MAATLAPALGVGTGHDSIWSARSSDRAGISGYRRLWLLRSCAALRRPRRTPIRPPPAGRRRHVTALPMTSRSAPGSHCGARSRDPGLVVDRRI